MKERTIKLINEFFERYPKMEVERENMTKAIELFTNTLKSDNKILIAGNGGSCADSEHISGELMKGFLLKRPIQGELRKKLVSEFGDDKMVSALQYGFQAIPLTAFSAVMTAFMNDCSPELVFAQEVLSLGRQGDLVLLISTSGNSSNILSCAKVARAMGIKTLALTGKSGGKLKDYCTLTVKAPETETFKIQEYHLPIYHLLCAACESEVFDL